MPWLTPEAPGSTIPLLIQVPDTLKPQVIGALFELCKPWNWEGFGGLTVEETVDFANIMLRDIQDNPSMTDIDAMHFSTSGEFSGLTDKPVPVPGDLVVIEDSENGWGKRKVEIGHFLLGADVIDYSELSTIVGWSYFTEKFINIIQIGKLVVVNFRIKGTSNNSATSFTVPDGLEPGYDCGYAMKFADNGTTSNNMGSTKTTAGSSVIGCFTNFIGSAGWTNSGGKTVQGTLSYSMS